jgi:hypothetical protein
MPVKVGKMAQCGWPAPSRQTWEPGLNGFSNGEYQSPQRSQPARSSPSASTAKTSPVIRNDRSRPISRVKFRALYAILWVGARRALGKAQCLA